jgi:succinoglycan biosynthesis protein ExoM
VTGTPVQATTTVDVAICTFRRPSVADTLRSVAGCELPPGTSLRIVVVDNDDTPSARPFVAAVAADVPVPVTYVHAPGRNISIARNAALDAAEARFVAFIDDDETATPQWLSSLLATQAREAADAVLGPVDAVYRDGAPAWLRAGNVHDTRPVVVGGRIVTGYTCNVLIDRASPAVRGRRFRVELGRSGGEDTTWFQGLTDAGGRIAYAPDALLYDPVPPSRESLGWLMRRRYRFGQTHGRILRERGLGTGATVVETGKAMAKALACFVVAVPLLPATSAFRTWLLRGALHVGTASALLGSRDLQLYGSPDGADAPTA